MAILEPTKIETIDYGQQYWNHIFNTNAKKVNQYFEVISGMWNNTAQDGQTIIYNHAQNKWVPGDVPVLPPPPTHHVSFTNGVAIINCQIGRFFLLDVSTALNISFLNFNDGVFINLIIKQDSIGNHSITFTDTLVVGEINTDANVTTWCQCYKINDNILMKVLGNFEE